MAIGPEIKKPPYKGGDDYPVSHMHVNVPVWYHPLSREEERVMIRRRAFGLSKTSGRGIRDWGRASHGECVSCRLETLRLKLDYRSGTVPVFHRTSPVNGRTVEVQPCEQNLLGYATIIDQGWGDVKPGRKLLSCLPDIVTSRIGHTGAGKAPAG